MFLNVWWYCNKDVYLQHKAKRAGRRTRDLFSLVRRLIKKIDMKNDIILGFAFGGTEV